MNKIRIWAFSDTHELHRSLTIPENIDIAICAGDVSNTNNKIYNTTKVGRFLEWFSSLDNIKHKIFVPGNHDVSIEARLNKPEEFPDITFLIHKSIKIGAIRIFGSPYTPTFGSGWAYNVDRDQIGNYWNDIPNGTDILVTHGPPQGILDRTYMGESVGDEALYQKVLEIKPLYHIFGHIHDNDRIKNHSSFNGSDTTFLNVSVVNDHYLKANEGMVFEVNEWDTFKNADLGTRLTKWDNES